MGLNLPPTKDDRKKCWAAKDAYFKCLDENNLWLEGLQPTTHEEITQIDTTNIVIQKKNSKNSHLFTCSQAREMFESSCLPSWYKHFSMLRVQDLQKKHWVGKIENEKVKDDGFWERMKEK